MLKNCSTYWFDNSPIRLSYWTRSASRSRALSLRSFSIIAICSKWHFSCSFNWFSNAKISSLALSTVRRIDANREGSCCEINYVCNIRVAVDHFFCDLRSDQDHFVKKWSKIRSRSWSWIFQKSDLRSDRDLRSRSLFYGKIFSMP